MTIEAELADGRVLEFPDGTSPEVIQKVVKRLVSGETPAPAPAPAQKGERTVGEAFTDTGAGLISGLGQLAQFPGQLYGLATGAIKDKDFATTGLQGVGKEMQDYAKTLKSAELKRREAETARKVQEAEKTGGQWAAFKTQLYESGTDPMQLGAFLAEQAPASIPSIIAAFIPGVGPAAAAEVKALQVAAQAATTVAAKQAAEQALGVALKKATESAVKRGTAASVGTGAVQQGTSVGVDAYKQVYDALIAKGMPPEQAASETINKARTAGAAGAVISLLTQRLPGAQAMERALAGEKGRLGRVAGAVVGGVKATPSEVLEEVGGKATQNVAAMTVNPEQRLTEGLGATAAQAGLGGFGMGSAVGALQGRQAPEAVTAPPPPPGGTQAPPPPPGGTQTPSPPPPAAAQQARQERVAQRTQELAQIIGNEEDAARIAEDEIVAEDERNRKMAAGVTDTPVKTRAQELIAAGMEPNQAYATATQQIADELENDALAKEQGALDVTGTKPKPSRKRTSVAGEPGTETPGGPETPARDGVVPTTTDAGLAATGETFEPSALIETETEGTTDGAQAAQTQQTETQEQKAPAAAVVKPPAPAFTYRGDAGSGDPHLQFNQGDTRFELSNNGGKPQFLVRKSDGTGNTFYAEGKKYDGRPNVFSAAELPAMYPNLPAPVVSALQNWLSSSGKEKQILGAKVAEALNPKAEAKQTETQEQKAPAAPVAQGIKVDVATAAAATDPAEIQKHLADIETEGATLLSKDGRFPKKGTTKRTRLDELGQLKRQLTEKLAPAPVAEEPVVEEPVAETPAVEEPVVEEPVVEEPVAETPAPAEEALAPVVEKPKRQRKPKAVEEPKADIAIEPEVSPPSKGVVNAFEAAKRRIPMGPSIGEQIAEEEAKEKASRKKVKDFEAEEKKRKAEEDRIAKEEKATAEEQAAAEAAERDEAAKARAGDVDTAPIEKQIAGALQEIIDSPRFAPGIRKDAKRHLDTITESAKDPESEAHEAGLEMAYNFVVAQASKPRFLRQGKKPRASIGMAKVTAIIEAIKARWRNAPEVVVVENINDPAVPTELQEADRKAVARGATGIPAGVFHRGKVYIFADQMTSTKDVVETLLHEALGHYGLRGVFGKGLKPILEQVARDFPKEMQALKEKYGLDFSNPKDVAEAAEEVLANLAATKPTMGIVQRAIAAVRRGLRSIGIDLKLSNNDLIANYILPARNFVEGERVNRAVGGDTSFSRATDAFLNWFGGSKVVDENGKPLVVYHGTLANITTFKMSPEGALGAGIYLTPRADFASTYADTSNLSRPDASIDEQSGQNVLPLYASIKTPLVLEGKGDPMVKALVKLGMNTAKAESLVEKAYEENGYVGKQVMTRAKAQGYDGIMQYRDGELMEVVAFSPNQVKSAIGNNGEYSLTNDDIRFSRVEEEGDEDFDVSEEETTDAVRSQREVDLAVKKAEFKFEESAKAQEAAKGVSAAQMAQDPRKVLPLVRQMWNRATAAQRRLMVKLPPTSFLVDWVQKEVPQLQATYKLMQKMAGMTNGLLKTAGELTNEVERAFRDDPTLRAKLDKITSVATLAEVDPGTIDTAERSEKLDTLWRELGPEGQRVYKRIRDHFDGLSKYLSKLLDDQVASSTSNLVDQANLMKKIRAVFEQGGKINPYFPLVREGDFWLSMGSGSTRTFFMAETAAERDNAAREFAADQLLRGANETEAQWNKRIDDKLGELTADGTFETGDNIRALREKPYSQGSNKMLTDVFNAIDNTDLGSAEANSELKDAIYQAFLETMPDQAFRKQFIHRKGVAGFRVDVLRNVAHTSAKMATQLARIKYSPMLRNALSAAEDSIRGRPQFEPFVNEMKERVDAAIAPKQQSTASSIVDGLNKASFIYYLSGASSAMLQPLSIFQTGLPVLARYGAFDAAKELAGMMKVWNQVGFHKTNADGTKSWVMPSMEYAKGLTPQQRRAYKAAEAMDLFTATQAGAVFNYKTTPTDKLRSPKMKVAKGTVDALVFGGLMNTSERLSREAMFMASFNLNMKEHGNFSQAVDQAVMDTNAALGNYGEYARPAFMNGLGGKVLTQFMMYPLHTASFLITNFKTMVAPMDGKDRAEAAQRFFGSLGTTFILAGAAGLPMFSTVMGMLGAAWSQMKDDDWPEEVRDMDFEFWFRTKCLDDLLGGLAPVIERGVFNAATGLDFAGRTGWGNLFSRDTKETATLRESATAMALEHAGPSANMILSMADGVDAAMQGDYAKAVKKWAPAGFRNFVNAHELATQGAKDNKGAELLSKDTFNTGLLIGQAVGFRSDLLANTQYVNFKVIGLEKRIQNERNQLLNNLDREYRKENYDAYAAYIDAIGKFNGRYPTYAITEDDVVDSLEKRAERRGTSWKGFVPNEKNAGLFADVVLPSRLAAEEAEKRANPK
jgi:hypothetical protein